MFYSESDLNPDATNDATVPRTREFSEEIGILSA